MYRLHCATALTTIIAGIIGATCAQATVRVGAAADIVHNVSGSLPGQTSNKKIRGDDVYENESIRTAAQSTAQITFVDTTGIELGPTATIKIDRVVFNPDHSVRALTVSAGAGAMRWISGASRSSAYEVKTPTVVIKVEGTTFDLIVEPKRTTVVLRDGRVETCSVEAPQLCKTLSEPGDMIIATPGALEGPRRSGLGLVDFAARCLSVASQNCGIATDRVSPPPQPPPYREAPKKRAELPSKQGTYRPASAPPEISPIPIPRHQYAISRPSRPSPETTPPRRHDDAISKIADTIRHYAVSSRRDEYRRPRTPRPDIYIGRRSTYPRGAG